MQLYLLAQELSKKPDVEVHFIVGDFGQQKIEQYGRITVYKGIPVKKHSWITRFLPRSKVLLFNLMRTIRADVYVQRSASAGTGLIALLAHVWGKQFVYMTAHEIDCNGGFEKQNSWLVGRLFQYGIRHADCIVTQSEEHAEMIAKHHKRTSIVIPSLYTIPTETELAGIEKQHILWVGRCEDWKRPEVFMTLAQQYPEESFVMISPASNNQTAYYKTLQNMLAHAPSNLRHVSYVPFAEIDRYFQEAKLFVNTSTYEGFPNTFVQAMKNRTPILSLSVNPDNMLNANECGVCAGGDIPTFEAQLKELLHNPARLTTLGQNGYTYSTRTHSSTVIAERYSALFQNLIRPVPLLKRMTYVLAKPRP